jgi:hypothetical protein
MRPIGRHLGPHAGGLLCFTLVVTISVPLATAGEPPGAVRHVVVYREEGRFAGWPANHAIWAWGDEVLVGFSRGSYKDHGPYHHIDHDRPEEFLLARSRDGGLTWAVEEPRPPGALVGTPGMRHGTSRRVRSRSGCPTRTSRSNSGTPTSP